MRLWSRSLKLASLMLMALGASAAGCVIDHDHGYPGDGHWNEQPNGGTEVVNEPAEALIDADATLDAKAGEGIGVMVEYATGGHWRVYTTCDYNSLENPGVACAFDVFATVLDAGGKIENPNGQDLSGKDSIEIQADGTVHLYTENTVSLGGMTFDTAPGATIELTAYFDGALDPHVLYWVGDGVLHRGAPTNPLHLVPSEKPVDRMEPSTDGTDTSAPAP